MAFKVATVCPHCQLARDLDLCRDPDLHMARSASGAAIWPCPRCHQPLEMTTVEAKLIDVVQKQMASYNLQDLRCQRCNQIKASSMSLLCECSGAYKGDIGSSDFWRKIRVIRDLAEYYRMAAVLELAEDCLRIH